MYSDKITDKSVFIEKNYINICYTKEQTSEAGGINCPIRSQHLLYKEVTMILLVNISLFVVFYKELISKVG